MLDEPNPNSPANNVAAQLYKDNKREYEKRVKVIVEESWIFHGSIDDDWQTWSGLHTSELYQFFIIRNFKTLLTWLTELVDIKTFCLFVCKTS